MSTGTSLMSLVHMNKKIHCDRGVVKRKQEVEVQGLLARLVKESCYEEGASHFRHEE